MKYVTYKLPNERVVKVPRWIFRIILKKSAKEASKAYFQDRPKNLENIKNVIDQSFLLAKACYSSIKEDSGKEKSEKYKQKFIKKLKFRLPFITFQSYIFIGITFLSLTGIFLLIIEWSEAYIINISEMGQSFILNVIMVLYGGSVVLVNKNSVIQVYELHKYVNKLIGDFRKYQGENSNIKD